MATTRRVQLEINPKGFDLTERDMLRVGAAAQRMADQIRRSGSEAPTHLKLVDAGMRNVRASAESMADRLGVAGSVLKAFGPTGIYVGAAVAGMAGLTAAIGAAALGAIKSVAALKDQATQAGVSAEQFQKLAFVEQQTGLAAGTLAEAHKKLDRSIAQSTAGTGTLFEMLKRTDPALLKQVQSARDSGEAFDILAKKMREYPRAAEAIALGNAAMGKGTTGLVLTLRNEGTAFDEMKDKAVAFSDETVEAMDRLDDQLGVLSHSISFTLKSALLETAPLFGWFAEQANKAAEGAAAAASQAERIRNMSAEEKEIRGRLSELELELGRATSPHKDEGILAPARPVEEINAEVVALQNRADAIEKNRAAEKAAAEDKKKADAEEAVRLAELAKAREAAEKAAEAAAKKAVAEHKQAVGEVEALEATARKAGLEGIKALEVERDLALEAAEKRFGVEVKDYELLTRAKIAIEKNFQAGVTDLKEKEAEKAAEEAKRAGEKLAREQERAAEKAAAEMRAPFENALEGIQQLGADTFVGIFDGSIRDAGSAADAIKAIFFRMLGELASLVLAKAIFQPLLAQFSGAATDASAAAAAAGGTSPAGGGLGGGIGLATTGLGLLGKFLGFAGGGENAALGTAASGLGTISQVGGIGLGALSLLNSRGNPVLRGLSGLQTINSAANLFGYGVGVGQVPGGGGAITFGGTPFLSTSNQTLGSLAGMFGGAVGNFPAATAGLSGALGAGFSAFGGGIAGLGSVIAPAVTAVPGAIAGSLLAGQGVLAGGSLGGLALSAGGSIVPVAAGAVPVAGAAAPAAGAAAGAAAIAGPIAGAIAAGIASYSFNQNLARFDSGRFENTKQNRLTQGLTPPLVAGPMMMARGNFGGGALAITFPFLQAIDSIFGTNVLGTHATETDYLTEFGEGLEKSLNKITGTDAFTRGAVKKPWGRATRESLAAGSGTDRRFLLQLAAGGIMEGALESPTGMLRRYPTGIRGRASQELREGFETIGQRGGDVDAAIAKVIRGMLGFQKAVEFVNRGVLEADSTHLRAGESLETFTHKLSLIIEIFGRQLPRSIDATATAAKVLAQDSVATVARIRQAASEQSRQQAAETISFTGLDEEEPFSIKAKHIKGADKRGQKARAALRAAETTTREAIFEHELSVQFAGDPAAGLRQAAASAQAAFDTLASVKKPEDLEAAAKATVEAVVSFEAALLAMVDAVRNGAVAIEDRKIAYFEEIDALRKSTDTHQKYAAYIGITEQRLAEQTSDAGRATQVERLMDLERARSNAEIQDIQEAAEERQKAIAKELEGINAMASLAKGLRDQVRVLTVASTDNPLAKLGQLALAQQKAQAEFNTATGDKRGEAAQTLAQTIAEQLQLAASVYGTGSSEFLNLQKRSLAVLRVLEKEATTAEERRDKLLEESKDLQEDTVKAIEAVQATLADRLESLAPILFDSMEGQQAALEKALTDALKPLNLTLEDVMGDPIVAQVKIQSKMHEVLTDIDRQISTFLNTALGYKATNPPPTTTPTTNPTTTPPTSTGVPTPTGPGDIAPGPLAPPSVTQQSIATRANAYVTVAFGPGAMVFNFPPAKTEAERDAYLRGGATKAAELVVTQIVGKMKALG